MRPWSHQTSPHVVMTQSGVTVISHTKQHSASKRPAAAESMRPAVSTAVTKNHFNMFRSSLSKA